MILKYLIGTYLFISIFFTGTEGLYASSYSVQDLGKLNSGFLASITAKDTARSRVYLYLILKTLREENNDNITTSNSQYYIGVYYFSSGNYSEAINWMKLSASMCEQLKTNEEIHSKCLFNLGIAYSKLGDFGRMEDYTLKSLEIEKSLYGDKSPLLLRGYSALVNAYYELNEYNKAIIYGNTALSLTGGSIENYKSDLAILYSNIGVCHARLSDYSKAVLYLEKAESIYTEYSLPEDENYINLLNSLAANYFFLGLHDKSDEYFNKGIQKTGSSNSVLSLNFMNSFAIVLGNAGKISKGADLIVNALEKAKRFYGPYSRDYFEVVKNYAEYLRTYKVDLKKSLELYEQCISYLNSHEDDFSLKEPVLLGYSLALSENGESQTSTEKPDIHQQKIRRLH
jgi:tetratricopeptide (TPR) repeat protein